MALFSNHLSILFLLINLLSSLQINARDTQFFHKNNNNGHVEKETNGYGVYGHDQSGHQLPPVSTPNHKPSNYNLMRKNYNPVASVPVPQDNLVETNFMNSPEFTTTSNNQYYDSDSTYDNNDNNYRRSSSTNSDQYHNGARVGLEANNFIESSSDGDYYYNNNDQVHDPSEARLMDKGYATSPTNNHGNVHRVKQQQGMSDTRFLKERMYFYDANTHRFKLSEKEHINFVNYHENEKDYEAEGSMP